MKEIQTVLKDDNLNYVQLSYTSSKTSQTATLDLCLQGGNICSYKPDGETELLWMSKTANFQSGKAIRGGIPICWPWFGDHWLEPGVLPKHGFARTARFELLTQEADEQSTRVVIGLIDEQQVEGYSRIKMELEIELSDHLSLQIKTKNLSNEPIEIGAALHSYFLISDVSKISIPQLKGLQYKDKTRNFEQHIQEDDLSVTQETDRIYLNPPSQVALLDHGAKHQINIESWGNADLVVWNPWDKTAKAMADFDDNGYQTMVCIEPANALENRVLLRPNEECVLGKKIKATLA